MPAENVAIIGAGIGGLACAIELAAKGFSVTVIEKAAQSGGKMRETIIGESRIDAGPTVFTMRWVFDALFADANASFADFVILQPLGVLARHAWSEKERFDLFADLERSADAVAQFSSLGEARRFKNFCAEAASIYQTLKEPFLTSPKPDPLTLTQRIGIFRPSALFGIRPFETLWGALSKHFQDPRLRQLFGRYATYSGSSPFLAPATLMLIAHVEQDGVWAIEGGMQRLADAMEQLARAKGVTFRFGEAAKSITVQNGAACGVVLDSGEVLDADSVVLNADAAALADGLFGTEAARGTNRVSRNERSLSAVTWAMEADTDGFPLLRHNVFFSSNYAAEFEDIFERGHLPQSPTVYVCAQDRLDDDADRRGSAERLLLLVNAPASGDEKTYTREDIAPCETRTFDLLRRCGLSIRQTPEMTVTMTPSDFHRQFPATGGALYGRASHGWMASFQRPASQTKIPGLYLAGGSTHPGSGVPMAALSGRLAAQRLLADRASTRKFRPVAISGGISTA